MGEHIYIRAREKEHAKESRRLWCAGRTRRGGAGDRHGAEYLDQGAATGVERWLRPGEIRHRIIDLFLAAPHGTAPDAIIGAH